MADGCGSKMTQDSACARVEWHRFHLVAGDSLSLPLACVELDVALGDFCSGVAWSIRAVGGCFAELPCITGDFSAGVARSITAVGPWLSMFFPLPKRPGSVRTRLPWASPCPWKASRAAPDRLEQRWRSWGFARSVDPPPMREVPARQRKPVVRLPSAIYSSQSPRGDMRDQKARPNRRREACLVENQRCAFIAHLRHVCRWRSFEGLDHRDVERFI